MQTNTDTQIMNRLTIAKIVEDRNEALRLAREGILKIIEAEKTVTQYGHVYPFMNSSLARVNTSVERMDDDLKLVAKSIDRDLWGHIGAISGIKAMMDSTARDSWDRQLAQDPPELTFDNIRATLLSLTQDRDIIFRRGLVSAFRRLDRSYITNKGFCIKKRVILGLGCAMDGKDGSEGRRRRG